MDFDTKIKVILRNDLQAWQELNVTAFLMSGIGGTQGIIGEPYQDADGVSYLPMSRQPIMILSADGETLREVLKKAVSRGMAVSVYTEELFDTYNDMDNRAAVSRYKTDELNLVGIAVYGAKNPLDRITKGLEMHK